MQSELRFLLTGFQPWVSLIRDFCEHIFAAELKYSKRSKKSPRHSYFPVCVSEIHVWNLFLKLNQRGEVKFKLFFYLHCVKLTGCESWVNAFKGIPHTQCCVHLFFPYLATRCPFMAICTPKKVI